MPLLGGSVGMHDEGTKPPKIDLWYYKIVALIVYNYNIVIMAIAEILT